MSEAQQVPAIELVGRQRQQIRDEKERRACESSLLAYTHAGWRWAGEPGRFVDNWHMECMCEHLEAVANRQILRLLINVPPRHGKVCCGRYCCKTIFWGPSEQCWVLLR
jgi:hypothetical protein